MKFKSLLVALAAMTLLPLANTARAEEGLELLVPGEISVATEGTYPPFSMRAPNGELDGLEIRVVKEIARRLGLEYKPVLVKWESVLIGLEADQYDIISDAMDITAERQKKVTFADGWLESGGRIVVRKDSDIAKPADVKGRAVGGSSPRTGPRSPRASAPTSRPTRRSPTACRIWPTAMSMRSSPATD